MRQWKWRVCEWLIAKLGQEKFCPVYHICTDGSFSESSGAGGWAFSISRGRDNEPFFSASGADKVEASHEMECRALEHALKWLSENETLCPGFVIVSIDFDPVSRGFFNDALTWEKRFWTCERHNLEKGGKVRQRFNSVRLWGDIIESRRALQARGFAFHESRVKSHAGHVGNMRVDHAARKAMRALHRELRDAWIAGLEAAE